MDEVLWVEKYRPQTIEKTILPDRYKEMFAQMISSGSIPNLIIAGSPGVGKTTIAKAMCDELGCSFMIINGSLDGNKDTLRNEIKDFASSVSMQGGRKYVILDEADGLSHNMQPALRNFMEEFSSNCGFILTCNLPHKIIPPLHSRCSLVEFNFSKEEKHALLKKTIIRVVDILKEQEIEHDLKTVAALTQKYFPDIRKLINELQKYSNNGQIDSGILVDFDEISLKQLIVALKDKNFDSIHKWVIEQDIDQHEIYSKLYKTAHKYLSQDSIAMLIVILAEYQYKAAFAVNPQINLLACLVEIAQGAEWKD
jgi:DNA polymerase III delta prime subunit